MYLVWNNENTKTLKNGNSGLFFIKSSNRGSDFDKIIQIADTNFGEAQLSANGDEVLVVWGGIHSKNIHNLILLKVMIMGITLQIQILFLIIFAESKNNNKNYNEKLATIINHPRNVELAINDLPSLFGRKKFLKLMGIYIIYG